MSGTPFYTVLANNTYVVAAYYKSGVSRTIYKGESENDALNAFIKRSDSFDKTNNNVRDVELYVRGESTLKEIVHPMDTSKE